MILNPATVLNPIFKTLDALISNYGVYLYLVFVWVCGNCLGIGRWFAAETVTWKLRHDHSRHHLYNATAESITTATRHHRD